MNEEKTKLLNLMRFWLFGTCVIVFAAISTYLRLIEEDMGRILRLGLPIWGVTSVAALLIYYGYKWYLKRQ